MAYNSSNQLVNPNAREAMDRFKMEWKPLPKSASI